MNIQYNVHLLNNEHREDRELFSVYFKEVEWNIIYFPKRPADLSFVKVRFMTRKQMEKIIGII